MIAAERNSCHRRVLACMYAGSLLGMSELVAVLRQVVQDSRSSEAGLVRQVSAACAKWTGCKLCRALLTARACPHFTKMGLWLTPARIRRL